MKLSVFSHFLTKSCNFEISILIACLIMMTSSVVTSDVLTKEKTVVPKLFIIGRASKT